MRSLINFTGDSFTWGNIAHGGGGGGKGYKTPEDKTAQAAQIQADAAAAQDAREAERQTAANTQAAADRAAETARQQTQFNTDLANAITGAGNRAQSYITGRGLNYGEYQPAVDAEIARIRSGIQNLDPNVGSYFTGDIGATVLGNEQSRRRDTYGQQVNAAFNPGWESQYFTPTSDDAILGDIVGGQYQTVADQLQRALDRGQLNQTGYNAAINRLGTDRTAANAQAQSIGQAVIDRDLGTLRDIGTQAASAAGNYQLGQTFDPNYWTSQRDTTGTNLRNSFEGDIRTAIGGTQFFNPTDYIATGGTAQGALNPQSSNIAEILSARAVRPRQQSNTSNAWSTASV